MSDWRRTLRDAVPLTLFIIGTFYTPPDPPPLEYLGRCPIGARRRRRFAI